MARPTKLTPETQAQILKALEAGATRRDAALSAGVNYATLLNWIKAGQGAKSGKFFEFFEAVSATEARVRIALANSLAVAAKTDWRAALEYLKRRDREHWGDAQQLDVTTHEIRPYQYGLAIARIATGSKPDLPSSGPDQGHCDGPALGQDDHGG